jgi:hypothetical protein
MFDVAVDLLAIPATSASVERVFSRLNLITESRKNKTGPESVQQKCFMSFNKHFFGDAF